MYQSNSKQDKGYEVEIAGRMVKLHGAVIWLLGDTW